MSCVIVKFDKSKHDRDQFDCGSEILNSYLKTRANQEQKKWLNIIYVAVPLRSNKEKLPVVGYYTLSNSAMTLASVTPEFKRNIPLTYDIPAIKIGRLAVDLSFQGKGYGECLLKSAFSKIIEVAALSGVRGIEVVAKNESATDFYKKFGFIQMIDASNLLYLPIETLMSAIEYN